jgi:hypothetical protein
MVPVTGTPASEITTFDRFLAGAGAGDFQLHFYNRNTVPPLLKKKALVSRGARRSDCTDIHLSTRNHQDAPRSCSYSNVLSHPLFYCLVIPAFVQSLYLG